MLPKYCIVLAIFFKCGICDYGRNISRELNGTVIDSKTLTHVEGPYLVTSDLVVAENASLIIEPGTQINFVPSVGVRVHGSLHAKGTPSHRITFRAVPCNESLSCKNSAIPYNQGIRLVGGTSHNNGRLELQWNGQWGTICADLWDLRDTQVACRQLGFLRAKRYYLHPGAGSVYLKYVECTGKEDSIWDCRYSWVSYWPCAHSQDIGIECDIHLPILAQRVYWKGIYFAPRNSTKNHRNSSLENVDIENAFDGIKAKREAPDLHGVTIRDGAYGLQVQELAKPMAIVDSTILSPAMIGVNIENLFGNVTMRNASIKNTRFGDGLVYTRTAADLCSVFPQKLSFPLLLNAVAKTSPTRCSQIFKASPGRRLTVHFTLIEGYGFQLDIVDGNTKNKTIISKITDTHRGKTFTISSSSVSEFIFYSKYAISFGGNLKMIIVEDSVLEPSILISNCEFSNNSESGIELNDVIGLSEISRTVVKGNSVGLQVKNARGRLQVVSSVFEANQNDGVEMNTMTGSVQFESVNSSKNQASGITIDTGTFSFQMTESRIEDNSVRGLFIVNQLNSTFNVSNTHFSRNKAGHGVYMTDFTKDCQIQLSNIWLLENGWHGALFQSVIASRFEVTSSLFDRNSRNGMYLEKVFSERLNLKNVSTSRNYKYGLVIEQGVTNAMIDSWYSIGNQNDGLNLKRQEGKLLVNHCVVHSNRQNGLLLTDGQFRRLQSLQLNNCQVSENSEYGVLFEINSAFSSYQDNYTITLSNSTISNNALGGFKLIPMFCYWKAYSLHRRVKLLFVGNVVTANQKFGLLVDGPEWYEAKAVLANNTFKENIGFAIKIGYKNFSNSLCKVFNSFPVRVQIVANIFTKNIGEYTCFIDYNALPAKRQVIINKNWFLENQGVKSFSNSYIRTKTQAVIAATEGNITVEHNSFDNPSFPHDFAFFFKDHSRVILARKNWWGTRDECKIKDRIFDFEDRVELPRIQYYPFLLFRNSSSAQVHSGVRPSCFVRGNKISGILDEAVNITKYFSPYQVIGDVIIQPEGVLTIEHGVTLEFPLKGLFLVHGQIIMRVSSKERVNFIPKTPSAQKLRLVEGPGPWEGKVEIWFNNTWLPVCMRTFRYEYKVVCRQLGYEWVKSYHNDSNGKDDMFLHNVRCDTDQTDNITDCNMKNWTSSLSCTTNVLHVSCKIPFWAGIHFAVTSKKSFFHNVDIQYAGFAYREDLGIPGIAFRVDLSRHIISRVSVSNSAGIGFQIMYPDPFDKSHGIVNSTISKTELDGIRLEAPFLSLLRVDVINTKGYGFLYHYNWNSLNAHVLTIADETAKKFIQTCTENETFIDDSSLVYYLAVTARSSVACQRTITVSQKYTIGVQLIHHDVNSSAPFYIYSGRNKSSSEVWDVQSIRWSNRPIWMTRNSSILLENSYGRSDYVSTIHLLLFLIKEGEAATSKSVNLIIIDSTFSHNAPGGIYLGGEDSGNIQIVNSAVRYSPRNGLETAFLRLDSLTVFNCEFMTHQIGIKLGSLQKWGAPQKLGSPGNVNIENSKVSNSTQEAIHVEDSNKLKSIHIKNSSVTHNDGFGLYLGGFYTSVKLLVTETRFAWNLGTSVYSRGRVCLYPCISRSVFKNSSFLNNLGPVVNIDGSPWEIESNVFANNTKAPVIVTPFSSRSDYRREVFVRKNHFLLNVCEEKGVIYITGNSKKMIIEGNVFRENYGRSIFIGEMFPANATIRSNVFKDNRCPNSGVIEVRRMEMDIEIVGNVFQFNQGLFMVRLHCEYAIRSRLFSVQKKLNFSKNSLSNNTEVSSRTQPCEVRISGLTNSKAISINYNIFNSNSFSKELCVNTHASSHRSILPVPLNFWGYEDEVKIKQRIFDAEDNYEHTLAGFHPFLNNAGNVVQNSSTRNTFDVPAEKYLGGRILFSVQLRKNQSPFIVLSDVTILPNASLTVEAGVEVRFKPGVGMLILGSLFVHGAKDEPVTFSLWKRNQSEKSLPVRLVGGKFPWQGRAEIFHQGNWIPVCLNKTASFETNSAKVVCEHLGYQTPLNTSFSPEKCTSVWTSCAFLSCNGSEADVKECSFSFHNLTCNSSTHVLLNCSGGKPWGNIRFVREVNSSSHHSTSYLQHVNIEHCGEIHGQEVAAIESIQYVPDLSFLTVLNCTAGSIKVWFPEKQVSITNSSFMNCGGNGVEIMNAKQNVAIESVRSVKNSYGLRFTIPNGGWMHGLSYGQADVCGSEKLVPVKDREVFLYFRKPFLTYSNPRVSCSVSVYSQEFYGLAVQMLVMRNMQYLSIYNHRSEVLKFSPKDLGPLSRRVIPWNYIRVDFEGWFQSEMILRVHSVEKKDIPCTFERGLCGWRNYPRPIYKGVAVTQKWHLDSRSGLFSSVNDHTYLWKSGTYIRLGLSYFQTGYGAITSPPISNDSNYCYFVFYYKLWMKGTAYLSILLEGLNGNESTILWSTNDTMDYWKKEVIMLPQTSSNYSIVFLGFFRYTAFIAIDDMDFIQCGLSPGVMHSVSESVFSGNYEQGISYMSNQTKSHILKIERCQITNNGLSPVLNGKPPGAIHLNAVDQVFKIVNNYLAENKNGGIFSSVRHEDPPSQPPQISQIHANTLESNKGGTLILEGNSEPYLNVNVTNNYFSLNLAQDWNGIGNSVCNITRLLAIVRGNFFYKNIGHYVFFYDLPKTNMTGLQFVNNTLYKNSASGLNVNYGATILCNGGAEIHGNVLHNPGNRYQISTTMQGSSLIANATFNWWGENVPDLIAFLILDKKKDYRLSLTVIFQPFIELLPRRVISESCPPEWIKEDEMCFLYKGGSLTFHEAEKYCWSYGGNLITMLSAEDKRLVNSLRQQESLVRPSVLPSLWIMGRRFVREPRSSYGQDNGICAVVDNYGNITESHCNRLNPFVCVRRPVVHCPNGCFHNGDCIGATCFCYPGWTGEDCSKFHCHDLHNCSGNGECMGPNVCRCYPGYLGRGCTYSFCGKYESCADCVTDPSCGWCDSLRSCLGGVAEGPPKIECPDWFYYHCYTVEDGECSWQIMRVKCKGKYCNYKDGRATIESCQKCRDLEKCHKLTEGGQCKAWNETHCPGGKVKVDYTDPERRNNVELAENVKLVEPKDTIIYACPVIMAKHDELSLILVAPNVLGIQAGDIVSSPQAGGILHKIVKEVNDGPLKLMLSAPAGLEEVIKYADFKGEMSPEQLDDESTLEDEPDVEDLDDLISGKVNSTESRIIILLPGIYKCLGHTYDIGSTFIYSYYLAIEKNNTIPKAGDIVVSNTSDGFIESVIEVHRTDDTDYLETKLQRCDKKTHLDGARLQESKQRFYGSVFCSGGDNNPGLVFSESDKRAGLFSHGDLITGRPSKGFIAKVIDTHSSGEFLLLEVVTAKLDENRTIVTEADTNLLQKHRRRTRRSTENVDLVNFQPERIDHKFLSTGGATLRMSLFMNLRLSVFVSIEKKFFGVGLKDASVGLELEGSLQFSLQFSLNGELRYSGNLRAIKDKQLGRSKYLRFGMIKIPVGIFLALTGQASAGISGTITRSLSINGGISLGGECRWSEGSCYKTDDTISLTSNWNSPRPELEIGANVDITVTPTVSLKVPALPKRLSKPSKSKPLNVLAKLVNAIADLIPDVSLSLFVSTPLKAGISLIYPSSLCQGETPAELDSYYGISDLIFGVSVNFIEKKLMLSYNTGFSLMSTSGCTECVCPIPADKYCVGPTSSPPTQGGCTAPETPPPKKKQKKKEGISKIPGPPCGKGPVCVGRRMGPECNQPDMWPFRDCSGNGEPILTGGCGALCSCFGGWRGEYCERITANGGGDPHLKTLDGVDFDFFGIGEFWGCKSVKNGFGLQFRFYYYERASLIGGIALKAGRSVVTIMTVKTENVQDLPMTRIDGREINATTNSSEPIEISNGTVLLDRQRRFSFEAEENSVVLISLQYDAGVTVTIDVRHSRVMKRQYLNILYSPTAAYKDHTEGLCGFMDNNATNDFRGPDETLYYNAIQFAESWRITDCHDGSGTRDSWSWNSSNFYYDDIMDITYTDPSYIPKYSLDGISQPLLQIATSMCKSLNISDNDLQSCIFDVAMTNDTTFTDQEIFKRDCPDQCSGKGRCINGTCQCIEGWTGKSCDRGSCLNCSTIHGKCVKGFCVCELGWEGRSCEVQATCLGVNNCTSPKHGSCKTTDICQCNPGYIGDDCGIVPTCYNVSNCTGNGICVDFDVCKCTTGWTGTNCTQYSCEQLDYCSEHGSCVDFAKCSCSYGWTGVSCALPDCEAVNQCSKNGECISSDKCRCLPGFVGADCGQVADCSHLANCSGQGVCVSTELLNVSCSCYLGFTGDNCSQPTCTTVNNCSAHGACVEAEFCKCDSGYIGADCSNFSCEAVNYCSGNGKCVGYDICLCNSSWSGRACSVPDCSAVKNCSGQGDCILPNICSCYPAFDGAYCDQKAKPNINPPRFDKKFYSAAIVENSPVGTVILQVKANDTDSGRNGQIFYTILGDDSIESILTVGGQSGKVYSAQTLDFETNEVKSFNVTMVAADNGYPQKSGIATVHLTLLDENDNCPTFIEPPGDLKLEFLALIPGETVTKVSAVDLDSGVNSDITYSLSKNDAFSIHTKTGVVTVVSDLTKKVYHLTVSASDNGDVSCTTDTSLTVKVGVSPTTKPLTRSTNPFTNRKSEASSTHSTFTLPESTTFTKGAITSNVPTEAGAVPQEGPNYAVIGGSAGGGVLLLLIAALVIRKCLCKSRTSSSKHTTGRSNAGMDFELARRI